MDEQRDCPVLAAEATLPTGPFRRSQNQLHSQSLIPPQAWHLVRSADNPADLASRGQSSRPCHFQLWWSGPPLAVFGSLGLVRTQTLQAALRHWLPSYPPISSDVFDSILLPRSALVPLLLISLIGEDSSADHASPQETRCLHFRRSLLRRTPQSQVKDLPPCPTAIPSRSRLFSRKQAPPSQGPRTPQIRPLRLLRRLPCPTQPCSRCRRPYRPQEVDPCLSKVTPNQTPPPYPPHHAQACRSLRPALHLAHTFYIPNLRNILKKISRTLCQRAYARPLGHQMGMLPPSRTTPAPPFDYAGPFVLCQGHTRTWLPVSHLFR